MFRGASPRQMGLAEGRLAANPRLAWKAKTTAAISSSPVADGKRVYVGSMDMSIYAFERATGKQAWALKTKGEIEAPPTLVGDALVVGSADGFLYCLDAARGTIRWKYKTDDKIAGAANAVAAPKGGGHWLVVGSYDAKVHCVDLKTGKPQWTFETGNYVNGAPAISDGKVIFGGCDGTLYVLRLLDGKRIGGVDIQSYIAGSAAVDGALAYVGHYGNEFVCANVVSGSVVWTYRDKAFPFFSSPAVTADRIIVGSRDRRLHCLDRRTGKALWTARTRGKVDSSPVICDGKIVVGSEDGRLYLFDLKSGKEVWSYQIGKPVISTPAVVDGQIYIGSDDGYLYAFRA